MKRRAKAELNRKVGVVREQLMSSLRQQFEKETAGSVSRIQEAVGPYTRFVRSEMSRLTESRDALERSMGELRRLEAEVRGL